MKRYLVILTLLFALPLVAAAQKTEIDALYGEYSGREDCVTFEMNGSTLRMMMEGGVAANPFDGVEIIRSIVAPAGDTDFSAKISRLPGEGGYKQLVVLKDKDVASTLYYRTIALDKKKTAEFLLVVFGPQENSVICVIGNVQPSGIMGMMGGAAVIPK